MIRLVTSGGSVNDPAVIEVRGSGTIWPGGLVDWARDADYLVAASSNTSTQTMVFGVAQSYVQGESDTMVKVVPITDEQLWEIDCANAITTGQIGVRQALTAVAAGKSRVLHNQETDVVDGTGIFLPLTISGATSGSARLIGRFIKSDGVYPQNSSTHI